MSRSWDYGPRGERPAGPAATTDRVTTVRTATGEVRFADLAAPDAEAHIDAVPSWVYDLSNMR